MWNVPGTSMFAFVAMQYCTVGVFWLCKMAARDQCGAKVAGSDVTPFFSKSPRNSDVHNSGLPLV